MFTGEAALAQDPERLRESPQLLDALARASAAVARLDHALASHPLLPAVLYRARLDAARRAAAVDGNAIDPWHLAAILEGLRLRMDPYLSMLDRGSIFDAARHAFDQYQWLVTPDFDQEGEIQAAEKALAAVSGVPALVAGGRGLHAWLERGGGRQPGRAALIRQLRRQGVLRVPYPLLGAASLRADVPWALGAWLPVFLTSLADEAEDGLQLLMTLERAWFSARTKAAGQRRTSRAGLAIDILAAAPLVSATSLGKALGMAVQNAAALLDRFCLEGVTIEVSHRAKRRLFGLTPLAPLRDGASPPRRPDPSRGRGRPRHAADPEPEVIEPLGPLPSLSPIERRSIDYTGLDAAMAFADEAIRNAKRLFVVRADPGRPLPPTNPIAVIAPDSGQWVGQKLESQARSGGRGDCVT